MCVLSTLVRGLVRGADRMSEFTSKCGSRTHNKGHGVRPTWIKLSSKFVAIVLYRIPEGTEALLTTQSLFNKVVAPRIREDFKSGTFSKENLEKYGFEPTQEGKLFLYFPLPRYFL
uniref:Uncharacterized protein n=1 Tax=Cynoglossus semilaevis TaxID=244447 RepID=A0A3P8W2A6_CYNSE